MTAIKLSTYLLVSTIFSAIGCSSDPAPKKASVPTGAGICLDGSNRPQAAYLLATASKDYKVDAKPIFDANCLGGCHSTGGTAAASAVLDTYAGVKAADPTKLKNSYQTAAANRMPKGGAELGLIQKSILDDFINAGRVEDKALVVVPPKTGGTGTDGKITYDGVVASVLKTDCVRCHDGSNTKIPNLTTYDGAKAEGANLALSLQDTSIHKTVVLPREVYIGILEQWVKDGLLEGKAVAEVSSPSAVSAPTNADAVPAAATTNPASYDPCVSSTGVTGKSTSTSGTIPQSTIPQSTIPQSTAPATY
jgi:hypothetical protein